MVSVYRVLADVVVVLHASYVGFVIIGQIAILLGWLLRWRWVHNLVFRVAHLTAILVVVLEAWCGITCPLTTWENWLRDKAGEATYEGDFIAEWMHQVLFFSWPPWVFTACYSTFGLLVVLSLVLVPPKGKPRVQQPLPK
jgi:polyferredoxin